MPLALQYWVNCMLVKALPRSAIILRGTPYVPIRMSKNVRTAVVAVFFAGHSQTYFVNASTVTNK